MRNIRVAPRSEWLITTQREAARRHRQFAVDLLASVPVVIFIVLLAMPFGPVQAGAPVLSIDSSRLAPGDSVIVRGEGFPKSQTGRLSWDGSVKGMPNFRAGKTGAFRVKMTIPQDASLGDHLLAAMASASTAEARSGVAELARLPVRISAEVTPAPDATERPAPTATPERTPTPTAAPTSAPTVTPALPTPVITPAPTPVITPAAPTPSAPAPTPAATPSATLPAPSATPGPTGPLWGLAGGYAGIDLSDMRRRGIGLAMVEMRWSSAEPVDGAFASTYFAQRRDEIARLRSLGFRVVLNFGMHHAPTWLLAKPNARYVNQFGGVYLASDEPNLVFATELRPYAERYTARVFAELGTDFYAVRVGGGHWGELTYPQVFKADGRIENLYWAFGSAAARSNPSPGWRPGMASPTGEASRFLTWYLNALTGYQNWQVATVRRSYPGPVAVLYASWGMRSGDFDRAVATNLSGTSSPEINGEVQRGFDHARHIGALRDANAVVWGTWGEKQGTVSWLSALAAAGGHGVMAENAGGDSVSSMDVAMTEASKYRLQALMWIRASELYCGCNGYATIADYQVRISSSP